MPQSAHDTQRSLFAPAAAGEEVGAFALLERAAELAQDPDLLLELERLPFAELSRVVRDLEQATALAASHGARVRAQSAASVAQEDARTAQRSPSAPKRFVPDRDADPPPSPRPVVSGQPKAALRAFDGDPQAPIGGAVHPKETFVTAPPTQTVPARGYRRVAPCLPAARCRRAGCEDCDSSHPGYQAKRRDEHRRAMEARAAAHLVARGAANGPDPAPDLRGADPTAYRGAPAHVVAADPAPRAVRERAETLAMTAERTSALGWVSGIDTKTGHARAWRIALCSRPVVAIQALPGRLKVGWTLAKCRDRACPACAASRSRELTASAREHAESRRADLGRAARLLFVTLTQRKLKGEGCSAAFERLISTWRRVMRRKAFQRCFSGGLRGTEIPWTAPPEKLSDAQQAGRERARKGMSKAERSRRERQDERQARVKFGGWHAHFHMALEVRVGVSRWYAECVLRTLWLEATAAAEYVQRMPDVVTCGTELAKRLGLPEIAKRWEVPGVAGYIVSDTRDRLLALDVQDLDEENLGQVCKYATKPFELPPEQAPKFFRAMAGRQLCAGFGTWRRFRHSGDDPGGPQWYTTTTFRRLYELAREGEQVEIWGTKREEPSRAIRWEAPHLFGSILRGDNDTTHPAPDWFLKLRTSVRNGTLKLGDAVHRHAVELHHADTHGKKWRPLTAPEATWHRGRTSQVCIGEIPAREIVRRLKKDPRPAWEHDHSIHCRDRGCGNDFRCEECDGLYGVCKLEPGYEQEDVCEDCWPLWAQNLGLPVDPGRFA